MTSRAHARLRVPVLRVIGGSAIAVAFGLGLGWASALLVEVITIVGAYLLYVLGGDDSDLGALVGGRADERQQLIRLRAAGLSTVVALVAIVVACVIAAAVHAVFWPYLVLALIIGAAYLLGLAVYGAGQDQADAAAEPDERGRLAA